MRTPRSGWCRSGPASAPGSPLRPARRTRLPALLTRMSIRPNCSTAVLHQRLAVGGLAHVAGHRQRVAQPRGQVEIVLVPAGGKDDAGARAVQHLREAPAKPGGRPGHDRDASPRSGRAARSRDQAVEPPGRVLDRHDLHVGVAGAAGEIAHGRGADEGADRLRVGPTRPCGRHQIALAAAKNRSISSPGAVNVSAARSSTTSTVPPGRTAARACRSASTGRGKSCTHSMRSTRS